VLLVIAALDERLRGPGARPPPLDHGLASAHLARLAEEMLERLPEERPAGRSALEAPDRVHWL